MSPGLEAPLGAVGCKHPLVLRTVLPMQGKVLAMPPCQGYQWSPVVEGWVGGGVPELLLTFWFCPCPAEENQEEEEEVMRPHGARGEAEAVRVAGGGSTHGVLAAALHQWG